MPTSLPIIIIHIPWSLYNNLRYFDKCQKCIINVDTFILFCAFHFSVLIVLDRDLLEGKTLTAMLSDLFSTSADKGSRRAFH